MADYTLGNTEAEHERLVRQSARFDPITERLLRRAGIGSGQRVLDLGSGAGDMALLLARLVGPSGEVVGVERNSDSIAWAENRVAQAGLSNVSFTQARVEELQTATRFDAAVGRFILMYLPEPATVVRSVSRLVRSGGVVTFQEPWWAPFYKLFEHLPLWSAGLSLIYETFGRSGADTEMGIALHRVFQDAGLPAPSMHMEMLLGDDSDLTLWVGDILQSMRPQIEQRDPLLAKLGDLKTLTGRIQQEVKACQAVVCWPPIVGAWSKV